MSEPKKSVVMTEALPRARQPSVYDIPWKSDQDALVSTRPSEGGSLIVVSKQNLRLSQLVYFRATTTASDNKVWKSRVDYYNGKYIVKAIREAKVQPLPPQIVAPTGPSGEGGEGGEGSPFKAPPKELVVRVVIPNIKQLRDFEQDIAAKKARIKDPAETRASWLDDDEDGESEESSEDSLWTDDDSASSFEFDQEEEITPLAVMSRRKKITAEQLLERLKTDQLTLTRWRDELVEREIARQERERLETLARLKEQLPVYGEQGEDDGMEWKFTEEGWIRVPRGQFNVVEDEPPEQAAVPYQEEFPLVEKNAMVTTASDSEYAEDDESESEDEKEGLEDEESEEGASSAVASVPEQPIKQLSAIYLYAMSLIPYPEQLTGRKRCITPFSWYPGVSINLEPSTHLTPKPLSFLNFSSLLDSICVAFPTFFKIGKLTRSRGFTARNTLVQDDTSTAWSQSLVPSAGRDDKVAVLKVVDVDSDMNDQIVYMLVPKRALALSHEPGEPADLIASEVEVEKMKLEAGKALSTGGTDYNDHYEVDEEFEWKAPPRFDVRQVKEKRRDFLELAEKGRTLEDIVTEFKKKETHRPDIALHPDPNVFHILTSVDYDSVRRPKIGRNAPLTRLFCMRSCGTVIFDISRSRKDLFDAWCYLKQHMELLGKKDVTDVEETEATRHLILVTSYLTWVKSPIGVLSKISPKTFLERVPHPDYKDFYTLENFVYRVGKSPFLKLKTTIIFTGVPFGHEQDVFTYFFKVAWDNERELPLFGPGRNIPPIIHVDDLSQIVADIITSRSYPQFVWALMPSGDSLKTIAESISSKFGYSKVVAEPSPGYKAKFCLPTIVNDLLKQHIRYDFVEDPYEFDPKLENPFTGNIMDLVLELEKERHLRESTVLLLGPPSKVKYEIAALLSRMYEVPLLHKGNIVNWFYKAYEGKDDAELPERLADEEDYEEQLDDEEEGEGEGEGEEGAPPKAKKQHRGGEWAKQFFKSMIETPEQNADRKWLVNCLRKLLTSVFIQSHGYILIDLPIRHEDAESLFTPKPPEENPDDEEEEPVIEEKIDIPDFVIYVEAPDDHFDPNDYILKHGVDFKSVTDIVKDLDEYSYYRSINKSSVDFFEEKNHKMYRLNVTEGTDLLLKCFAIIGPPRQIHGLSMFTKFLHDQFVFNPFSRYREKHEKHLQSYFNIMEKIGINSLLESKINKKSSLREYLLDQPLLEYKEKELGVDTADSLNIQTDSNACGKARVKNRWRRKAEIFNCLEERAQNHYWHEFRRLWWSSYFEDESHATDARVLLCNPHSPPVKIAE